MATTPADAVRYRIEIKRVRRKLAHPLQTGGGHCIDVRESVLLKVTAGADPARTGYGEAATLPWFGTESAAKAAAVLAAIGGVLRLNCGASEAATLPAASLMALPVAASSTVNVGREQGSLAGHLWQDALEPVLPPALAEALSVTPCARFALECALRQAGALVPLAGAPANIPVAALLPAGTATIPQSLLAAGFRVFKIKIGVCPFADEAARIVALLTLLRQLASTDNAAATTTFQAGNATISKATVSGKAGASRGTAANNNTNGISKIAANGNTAKAAIPSRSPFRLRLDANGGLSATSLQAWLRLLAPFADCVDFIEQPLPVGQERQTAEIFATGGILSSASRTPAVPPLSFAFDESLTSLPQLRRVGEAFPQAVLVVKPSLLGSTEGFLRWRQHDVEARGRNLEIGQRNSEAGQCGSEAARHNPAAGQRDAEAERAVPRRIIYSSALETGIGLHHALHLAATDPFTPEPVGFGTGSLFAPDGLGAPPQQAASIAFSPARLVAESSAADAAIATGGAGDAQHLRAQMEALWRQV